MLHTHSRTRPCRNRDVTGCSRLWRRREFLLHASRCVPFEPEERFRLLFCHYKISRCVFTFNASLRSERFATEPSQSFLKFFTLTVDHVSAGIVTSRDVHACGAGARFCCTTHNSRCDGFEPEEKFRLQFCHYKIPRLAFTFKFSLRSWSFATEPSQSF